MSQVDPMNSARDDAESADAAEPDLDLSPRVAPARGSKSGGGSRKVVVVCGIGLLVVILGAVLFKGLSDASLFYYNVDEAVAKKAELGGSRFRMQGNVIDGTIHKTNDGVTFVIAFGDSEVPVVNNGAPPQLFSAEIPVVLEGHWAGDEFHSDEIIIRHDNKYDEKHSDRLKKAHDDIKNRSESKE